MIRIENRLITRIVCLFCFALSVSISTASGLTLRLSSDPLCPYTCDPQSSSPGYLVELTREILENNGISIRYRTKPWKRVLVETRAGRIDGAMTVDESDSEGMILNKVPFAWTIQTILTRKDDPFEWRGVDHITDCIFVAINGYTYGKEFNQWIQSDSRTAMIHLISGEDALPRSMRMIVQGRGDLLVNDLNALQYLADKMNLTNHIRLQPTGSRTAMYIGISSKRKDAQHLADLLDDGLTNPEIQPLIELLKNKYHIQ